MIVKAQLNAHIRDYQQTRIVSDPLQAMLTELFAGAIHRFGQHARERWDDMQQDAWIWFIRYADKIDTEQDPFAFITQCVRNMIYVDARRFRPSVSLDCLREETGLDLADPRPFVSPVLGQFPMILGTLPVATEEKPAATNYDTDMQDHVAAYHQDGKAVVADKEVVPLWKWAKENNQPYWTILNRIRRGWNPNEAATRPKTPKEKWIVNGKPLQTHCREVGLRYDTIRWRLHHGWDLQRALSTPIKTKTNTTPTVSA
jgi:DNA-directed RNA polymerase specialized sigma24 family protein